MSVRLITVRDERTIICRRAITGMRWVCDQRALISLSSCDERGIIV
jgi:hypothetical protein